MKPKTQLASEINKSREDDNEKELSERETMLAAEESFTKTLQLIFSEQPENLLHLWNTNRMLGKRKQNDKELLLGRE